MTDKELKLRDNLFQQAYNKYYNLLTSVERYVGSIKTTGYTEYAQKKIEADFLAGLQLTELLELEDKFCNNGTDPSKWGLHKKYGDLDSDLKDLNDQYKALCNDLTDYELLQSFTVSIENLTNELLAYAEDQLTNGLEYYIIRPPETFPPTNPRENMVYLVPKQHSGTSKDYYVEYVWLKDNSTNPPSHVWEKLGYIDNSKIDTSVYDRATQLLVNEVGALYSSVNSYEIALRDIRDNYLTYIEDSYIRARTNEGIRLTTFSGHNEIYSMALSNKTAERGDIGQTGYDVTLTIASNKITASTHYFPNNTSSVSTVDLDALERLFNPRQDLNLLTFGNCKYLYGGKIQNGVVSVNVKLCISNGDKGDKGATGQDGSELDISQTNDNLIFSFDNGTVTTSHDFNLDTFDNPNLTVRTLEHNDEMYITGNTLVSESLMTYDSSNDSVNVSSYSTSYNSSNLTLSFNLSVDAYYHTIYSNNISLGTVSLYNGTSVSNGISNITDSTTTFNIALTNNTSVNVSKTLNVAIDNNQYDISNIENNFILESNIGTITTNGITGIVGHQEDSNGYPNLLKLIMNDDSTTDIILHNTDAIQNSFYSFDTNYVYEYDATLQYTVLKTYLSLLHNGTSLGTVEIVGSKGDAERGEDGYGADSIDVTETDYNTEVVITPVKQSVLPTTISLPKQEDSITINTVDDSTTGNYTITFHSSRTDTSYTLAPINLDGGYGIRSVTVTHQATDDPNDYTEVEIVQDNDDGTDTDTITLNIPNKQGYSNSLSYSQSGSDVIISTEHNSLTLTNKPSPNFEIEEIRSRAAPNSEQGTISQKFRITDNDNSSTADLNIYNGNWIGNYPLVTNKLNNPAYIGKNIDTTGLSVANISSYFAGQCINSSEDSNSIHNDLMMPVVIIVNTDKVISGVNKSKMVMRTLSPNETYQIDSNTYIWYIYKVGTTDTVELNTDRWAV